MPATSPWISDFEFDRDSPSPYPPSTPSIDTDDEYEPPTSLAHLGLRASVAALTDRQLRTIVLKLLDSNYAFRRAMQKEVAFMEEPDTPPTTPTRATHRRGRSKKASRTRKSRGHTVEEKRGNTKPTVHQSLASKPDSLPPPRVDSDMNDDTMADERDCVYHPGHLEDEVYEFVSRTPNGAAFKVVQTVTMWSCCNEDEWSPGCILIAPTYANSSSSSPSPLSHSNLGRGAEEDSVEELPLSVGHGRLAPLQTKLSLGGQGQDDVYPDSELESPYSSDLLTPVSYGRGYHSIA